MLDFEKAFDSVNVNFLQKALDSFKFGDSFKKWIRILYTEVNSCVTNNGYASDFFEVSRGIRQGCPISAMLFIIVVELLSIHLKSCKNVKGLDINNELFTITQLADGTTLFLKDSESIHCVMFIMDMFYECSGLRLNKQKCELFILGNCGQSNNTPTSVCGVKITSCFKALGIYFSHNCDEMYKYNFDDKLNKLQVLLNIWRQRD